MSRMEMVHMVPALRSPLSDRMFDYAYSPYGLVPSPTDFLNWDAGSPLFHQTELKTESSPYQLEACSPHSLHSPSPLPALLQPLTPVSDLDLFGMGQFTNEIEEDGKPDDKSTLECLQPYSRPTGYKSPPQEQSILHSVLSSKTQRPKPYEHKVQSKPQTTQPSLAGNSDKQDVMADIYALVLSMAETEIHQVSQRLGIPRNPSTWTRTDVIRWIQNVSQEMSLQSLQVSSFDVTGEELVAMTEENFRFRFPQGGSTLYAKLYIWTMTCEKENQAVPSISLQIPEVEILPPLADTELDSADACLPLSVASPQFSISSPKCYLSPMSCPEFGAPSPCTSGSVPTPSPSFYGDLRDDDDDEADDSSRGVSHIHLWQFVKELLLQPELYGPAIRWVNRDEGIFKIEDSVRVARLWGRRKNRPAMNYDKLSRSLRQYYKKGVMKKTERSQRLVYQFCDPYFK